MKKLLSIAFVTALMTVGSLRAAEEARTPQTHGEMKPGHTVEAHKMNGGQTRHNEPVRKEVAHGMNNERQNHEQGPDTHRHGPNMPLRSAATHHQMEHGAPHHAEVHSNVSSMGQPWPKLSGPDQALYKQNMNDILVLQNGLFNNPKLTGDSGFNAEVYNGTFIRNILQTCDTFCQDTNQDRCAFVDGLKNSRGLSIPADRQTFLTCFHKGVVAQPSRYGIAGYGPIQVCQFNCTGGGGGHSNACGDKEIRQGCKLLCCNGIGHIGVCLGNNNDYSGCDGY